jgi:NAD(P)-dependent dehydrogenase (short-subunit alcohol dehydrogenase family)
MRFCWLGATVVVNDLGGASTGGGSSREPARKVVAEIEAMGGTALADSADVRSYADMKRLVDTTVGRFGRIDIVITSAGIAQYVPMEELMPEQFDEMVRVHLYGTFNLVHCAWPHLIASGSGRVVMTTSNAGLFGGPNAHYAAAKMGVVGLMRSLAFQGRPHGVHVNAVAPGAVTRMVEDVRPDSDFVAWLRPIVPPGKVSPTYALLAHERCELTGEVFAAAGGRTTRVFFAQTRGWGMPNPTVDDLREHVGEVIAEEGYVLPPDMKADEQDWAKYFGSIAEDSAMPVMTDAPS